MHISRNTCKKSKTWDLSAVLHYAKILNVRIPRLSDELTMRESKEIIEKRILEELHPYRIYENKSVPGQWATHLPDPTRKDGRRLVRRNSYERICQAVIEFYIEDMHLNIDLDTLFDEWIIFRRDETSAKPGSLRKFTSLWRAHCREATIDNKPLSKWKVADITPTHLYRFFRKLTKNRTYTRQMVNDIRCVLSGMFAYAIEKDIIQMNPVRDVDLRRLAYKPVQEKHDDVFTQEEAEKLLDYLDTIEDDPYTLAIRLDFNLFTRIGEITGLMWENVYLENRIVNICHQITYEPELNDDLTFSGKKIVTENYLKGCTSHGYREEYLNDEAVDILKRAKAINPDGKYVFMPFGKPIVTLTFNKRLKKYCEAAGIPYHSSHKIRFYAASSAYNGSNLLAVSRMMGHSQTSTTLHYLRDVNQDGNNAELFEKLGRNRKKDQ